MKRFIPILLLGSMACCQTPTDHFVFRGHIPGAKDSTRVTLYPKSNFKSFSGYVKDEKFEIRGAVKEATLCLLRTDDHVLVRGTRKDITYKDLYFFIENGNLTFETPHIDSLPAGYGGDDRKERNYMLKGSVAQDAFYRYQQQSLPYRCEIERLKKKSKVSQSEEDYEELFQRQDELERVALEFVQSQQCLPVNLYVAEQLKRRPLTCDMAHVEAWEQAFASYQDTCVRLRNFREYLREAKGLVTGKELEDAGLLTPEGKEVRLLDCLNKEGYTLLDFWASWCGACRAGLPAVKALHERYGKRIKFASIALGDREDAWMQAVKEENMPWAQFRDGGELANLMQQCYKVTSIPTLFLVSPEGKIVWRASRAGEMEVYLKSSLEI